MNRGYYKASILLSIVRHQLSSKFIQNVALKPSCLLILLVPVVFAVYLYYQPNLS